MAFDLASAKPVSGGFDLSTAKPLQGENDRIQESPSLKDSLYRTANALFRSQSVMDGRDGALAGSAAPEQTAMALNILRNAEIDARNQAQGSLRQSDVKVVDGLPGVAEIGARKGYAGIGRIEAGAVQLLADALGSNTLHGIADEQMAYADRIERGAQLRDSLVKGFSSESIAQDLPQAGANAIGSVIQTAPALAAGAVAPEAVLPAIFATTSAQEYGEGRKAGLTPAGAAIRAPVQGAFEVIGEKLGGTKALAKGIERLSGGNGVAELAAAMGKSAVKELPSEEFTTAGQFLTDKLPGVGINQEAGLDEYLKQAKDTALATLLQSGAIGAGAHLLNKGGALEAPPETETPVQTDYDAVLSTLAKAKELADARRAQPDKAQGFDLATAQPVAQQDQALALLNELEGTSLPQAATGTAATSPGAGQPAAPIQNVDAINTSAQSVEIPAENVHITEPATQTASAPVPVAQQAEADNGPTAAPRTSVLDTAGRVDRAGGTGVDAGRPTELRPDTGATVGNAAQGGAVLDGRGADAVAPAFTVSQDGSLRVTGFTNEQVGAARDALKIKGAIIGTNGNAIFPKGTDVAALKRQLGMAEAKPMPKARKPQRVSSDLLQRIKQLGGVDSGSVKDITGEPKAPGGWRFAFSKTGRGLDDLAISLADEGFNIDTNDTDGGVQQLRDMIRAHINGERNFKASTIEAQAEAMAASRYSDDLIAHAEELGINWRNLSAEQLDDAIYLAEDELRMAAIAEEERATEAEREALDAVISDETISDDELDIPFGDNIQVDQAAMDAHFGVTNEETDNGQADGAAGRESAQGTADGIRGGQAAQGGKVLQSYTNAEVLKREAAAKKAEEEANKEPPAKHVTADQADMFSTQGALFNSNREQPSEQSKQSAIEAIKADPDLSKSDKIKLAAEIRQGNVTQEDIAAIAGEPPLTGGEDVMQSTAWHGSPHDHDGFDMSKVGTGEGAHAYGYGLYFASNKAVGEYYKDAGVTVSPRLKMVLDSHGGDNKKAVSAIKEAIAGNHNGGEAVWGDVLKEAEALKDGKLYQVELAPAEDEYLLWDKPLSEQSEKVKAALGVVTRDFDAEDRLFARAQELGVSPETMPEYTKLSEQMDKAGRFSRESGEGLYRKLTLDRGSDKAASEHLHSLGIRGIKYLDGSSRSNGEGSYNYVIFNDQDVSITAKFSQRQGAGSQTVASVTKATARLRNGWHGFTNIHIVQSVREVPNDIYLRALRALRPIDEKTEGVYDPVTKSVYLIAGNIATPERAVWVAVHEVVGHGGIRMLGRSVKETVETAAKNSTVAKMAKAIAADREEPFNAVKHVDEAIAELAAAHITGDFDALLARYRVAVPAEMRGGLMALVKRVVDALRNFMRAALGKPGEQDEEVSDAEILDLLRQMNGKVEGKAQAVEQGDDGNYVPASRAPAENESDAAPRDTDIVARILPKSVPLLYGRDELGNIRSELLGTRRFKDFLHAAFFRPMGVKLGMAQATPELAKLIRRQKADLDKAMRIAAEVVDSTKNMTEEEAALISRIVTQEARHDDVPPEHALKIAAVVEQAMTQQGQDAVDLKMLSEDAYEKWKGRYLPRFYLRHLDPEIKGVWRRAFKSSPVDGFRSGSLKGRGKRQVVMVAELPQWEALGWKLDDKRIMRSGNLELMLDGKPLPDTDSVTIWKDYTPEERRDMGEVEDFRLRFVMGYLSMQRDLSVGRLYKTIAENTEWTRRTPSDGFVYVPETEIPDTGGLKRYGMLSGMYVQKEILDHISQYEQNNGEFARYYKAALSKWKEGKTVLNPVTHMNNLVSNLTMAHFAGVSYWDGEKYYFALRDLVRGDQLVNEAEDAGLFTGDFSQEEIMRGMPPEVRNLIAASADSTALKTGRFVWGLASLGLNEKAAKAYHLGDTLFKYAIYRDARSKGMNPEDAVQYATKFIFNYDDLPVTARGLRDYALPFFGYTYKVVPALIHTAVEYPWRFAAPAAMIASINALVYASLAGDGGDDDWWLTAIANGTMNALLNAYTLGLYGDGEAKTAGQMLEQDERKNLPEWDKGGSALGTQKTIRLGTDEKTGLPVFMNVYRFIPGGDIQDVNNEKGGIGGIPAPLMPSHPLLGLYSSLIDNRNWDGKELFDPNDTGSDKAKKAADFTYRQLMPAIAPMGTHYDRIMQGAANYFDTTLEKAHLLKDYTGIGRDGLPVQPKYAAMQTLGIKARPANLELSAELENGKNAGVAKSIKAEIRSAARLLDKGAISQREYDRIEREGMEKIDALVATE